MADNEKYLLSVEQSQTIFETRILPDYFGRQQTGHHQAYLLGGQPASGKTKIIDALVERHGNDNVVVINGDDFRDYHPKYADLIKQDPKTAAFYTDKDSGRWVEKTIEYGKNLGVNMIIEGTMRNPTVPEKTAKMFHEAGYQVEAVAMAVPERESWLGVHKRFELALAKNQPARFSAKASHDAALFGILETLDQIHQNKTLDKLTIVTRDNQILYSNTLKNGEWALDQSGRQAVMDYRLKPISLAEQKEHITQWDKIISTMASRHAPSVDIERVQKYKSVFQHGFNDPLFAKEMVNNKKFHDEIFKKIEQIAHNKQDIELNIISKILEKNQK